MSDSERRGGTSPDDETVRGEAPRHAGVPERIGAFRINRVIASGGMGTVYEATQEEPRRIVAVKVMKEGALSDEALRRFRYEAQLLARLRHPGIAQVYEAGTHDDGAGPVPYFAMEYVTNAKPITVYAAEKKLGMEERLTLFADACDAVHHGHQKGIIHRDLKPDNILVDSSGKPRIIDFGVARAVDSDMATIQTAVGQIVGTVQYMSPEQFDADPNDIDTRSDVYALGLVLYELLGGQSPYDVRNSTIYDAARIVREQSPRRLSELDRSLRGDVETIVQKALDKDRDRRYQSAYGLARDIRHYLGGEAIEARPPSMAYQMQVFARRHKGVIAAAAAVFVILVAATVVSTTLYLDAKKQRAIAERQTEKSREAVTFLTDMLNTVNPDDFGSDVSLRDLLDWTSQKVDGAFPDDPEVEASIRHAVGMGYFNIDFHGRDVGRQLQAAWRVLEKTEGNLEQKREVLGSLTIWYDIFGHREELVEARRALQDLTLQLYGPDDNRSLSAAFRLADALAINDQMEEAGAVCEGVLERAGRIYGEDDEHTLAASTLQAWILMRTGRVDEAEALGRNVLERSERLLGGTHRVAREARSLVAACLLESGDMQGASTLYGGRTVPGDLGVEKSFQGELGSLGVGPKMLVFWETWCPFSQRAMPRLEEFYERYRGSNLDIVGVTAVSASATDDDVEAFIREKAVTFPIVKDNGIARPFFAPRGTPWIVLVSDGKVVWENMYVTPEKMPETLVRNLVGAAPAIKGAD